MFYIILFNEDNYKSGSRGMLTFVPKKLYICTFSIVGRVRHTNIGFCLMLPTCKHKHAQKGKGCTSQVNTGLPSYICFFRSLFSVRWHNWKSLLISATEINMFDFTNVWFRLNLPKNVPPRWMTNKGRRKDEESQDSGCSCVIKLSQHKIKWSWPLFGFFITHWCPSDNVQIYTNCNP